MDSVIHLLNNWSLGCSWIHVIHSSIPFVHRNLIVMLAHPAGDDVTTSITLSRFSVSLLIDRTSGSCFFVPLLPRIRKRTKIVTLKWIFTTTKSRLPEVVILRKCLGKPQIRLKLQHIKGVSWLLAGPKAKPPNRVNGRKFCKSLNRRVLEIQTKSNTLNKFSRCFLRVFRYLFGE